MKKNISRISVVLVCIAILVNSVSCATLKETFSNIKEGVVDVAENVKDGVVDAYNSVSDWVSDKVDDIKEKQTLKKTDNVAEVADEVTDEPEDSGIIFDIPEFGKKDEEINFDEIDETNLPDIATLAQTKTEEISNAVSETAEKAADTVSEKIDETVETVESVSEEVTDAVVNAASNAADAVADKAEEAKETVSEALENVAEQIEITITPKSEEKEVSENADVSAESDIPQMKEEVITKVEETPAVNNPVADTEVPVSEQPDQEASKITVSAPENANKSTAVTLVLLLAGCVVAVGVVYKLLFSKKKSNKKEEVK